jgi:hypothetical protein
MTTYLYHYLYHWDQTDVLSAWCDRRRAAIISSATSRWHYMVPYYMILLCILVDHWYLQDYAMVRGIGIFATWSGLSLAWSWSQASSAGTCSPTRAPRRDWAARAAPRYKDTCTIEYTPEFLTTKLQTFADPKDTEEVLLPVYIENMCSSGH